MFDANFADNGLMDSFRPEIPGIAGGSDRRSDRDLDDFDPVLLPEEAG
jgi:hypothetical protein